MIGVGLSDIDEGLAADEVVGVPDLLTAPVAGTRTLTLTTPHSDDGAFLLRLDGPNLEPVASAAPAYCCRFLETFSQSGDEVTAVFVGDVGPVALITFRVPDASPAGTYEATRLALADRANVLRGSLAGQELTVTAGS